MSIFEMDFIMRNLQERERRAMYRKWKNEKIPGRWVFIPDEDSKSMVKCSNCLRPIKECECEVTTAFVGE